MKRHDFIVGICAKHTDLDISNFLNCARSFVHEIDRDVKCCQSSRNIRNARNRCSSCYALEVPATVIVLWIVTNDGLVMAPHFFEEGRRINAAAYIKVLDKVVRRRLTVHVEVDLTSFNKTLPQHTIPLELSQDWMAVSFHDHIPLPPSTF